MCIRNNESKPATEVNRNMHYYIFNSFIKFSLRTKPYLDVNHKIIAYFPEVSRKKKVPPILSALAEDQSGNDELFHINI